MLNIFHRVEDVLFYEGDLAPDLLTIKETNITATVVLDVLHYNLETFSKVQGMFFPMETSSVFLFSKNPIKVEKNAFQNFFPIQANVYLWMLALMTLVSFILVLTNNKIKGGVKVINSQTSELSNMAAIIIRQGDISSSRSPSNTILFGAWLLGAFLFSVMIQTYLKCEFANVQYIPMDSVADVADNLDVVEPMVLGDNYIETFLNVRPKFHDGSIQLHFNRRDLVFNWQTSLDPKARSLWKHLKETDQLLTTDNFIYRVQETKHFVLFITKSILLVMGPDLLGLSELDRVHESSPIFTANLGLAHSSDLSPTCKEHFNRKFIKFQEIKFMETKQNETVYKYDHRTFRPTLEQDSESVLSFGEAKSTFALLTIGFVASITYFAVHLIFASRNALEKRSKFRRSRRRRSVLPL